MGVPSCCLCSSHDSGVSTPSAFSQSKNTLGRSLNQLEISFPRPNVKTILFPIPSLPPIYTQIRTSPAVCYRLTRVSRWDSLSGTGHLIQSGGGIGPSKPQQPDPIYGSLVLSPAPVSGAKIRSGSL